jgi:NDP-sugar pyrophosphorylase family protein
MAQDKKRKAAVTTTALAQCDAIILAGGLGTRLRSVVPDTQKVLAPVQGTPCIIRHFETLLELGIKRVILCTGYKADQVQETLGTHYKGLEIVYSVEKEPLGTGGALGLASSKVRSDTALVLNGDSLAELSYGDFWQFHARDERSASLALFSVEDTSRYGEVTLRGETITHFKEKAGSTGRGLVNGGVYLIARELLEGIAATTSLSLEREVFPFWGELSALRGWQSAEGGFIDIGTPESYQEAQRTIPKKRSGATGRRSPGRKNVEARA